MNNSLSFYYIIFGIVLLHLLLGFAWVIYKFMKPVRKDKEEDSRKDKEQ